MRRVLLYCHNVEGLGHIARTVRIAEALNDRGGTQVVIVTGCRFLTQFRERVAHRAGLDFHPLPWLAHGGGGLVGDGGQRSSVVLAERERSICSFARSWQPHVFVADHNPAGLSGELWPTLETARRERWPTKFVWGARDIWDSPAFLARLQRRIRRFRLTECLEHYDAVMAYSDARWIDTLAFYEGQLRLPRDRHAVGVVAPLVSAQTGVNTRARLVLAMGGGSYGHRLIELVWQEVKDLVRHGRADLRVVLGPHADPLVPAMIDWEEAGVAVVRDTPVEAVILDADLTISTAGYGTAYTVVQGPRRNIFIPLPGDGQEQSFRATKLASLPGIAMVDALSHPAIGELRRTLEQLLSESVARSLPFSHDGAATAAAFVERIALEPSFRA
jgi:predicted glycosyltransferase